MRLALVAALVIASGCAQSSSCRDDLAIDGCPCTPALAGVCRYESPCDGGRCRVLICDWTGRWAPRNCIDCCGETDAGPPPDAVSWYPACTYPLPSLDLSSPGGPVPIILEGGEPLADDTLTVTGIAFGAGTLRLTVANATEARTFVVAGAHAPPEVHVGDTVSVVLDATPALFDGTRLLVLDAVGRPVAEYARARGVADRALGAGVALLSGDFFGALMLRGDAIALAIDCREPDGGFCGRAATAWALTSGRERAVQGGLVTLHGVGNAFTVALDVLADDFEERPSPGACTAPTHGVLSLEAHSIAYWLDAGQGDAAFVDAGP